MLHILFMGDANFGHTRRGYASNSHRAFAKHLARKGSRTLVVWINEFRSSKLCCWCGSKVEMDGKRVVTCKSCLGSRSPVRRLAARRDRDLNGAVNLLVFGLRALLAPGEGLEDTLPKPWRRSTPATELA